MKLGGSKLKIAFTVMLLNAFGLLQAQIYFDSIQTFPSGDFSQVACIADVNSDGKNDLVVGCSFLDDPTDYVVKVFMQDSLGALQPAISYPYPAIYAGVTSMAVGDLNQDGRNDIVIGCSKNVHIAYQTAAGTIGAFSPLTTKEGAFKVNLADLNNDGLLDLVVNHNNETYFRLYYQVLNSSTFSMVTLPKFLGKSFGEIAFGDVNNDGRVDLVYTTRTLPWGIEVYAQSVSGTFNYSAAYQSPTTFSNSIHHLAVGDVNHDGLSDIVGSNAANTPYSWLAYWFQDSVTPLLQNPGYELLFDIPNQTKIADLDCDGKMEVIVGHTGWGRTSVTQFNSTGVDTTFYYYNVYGNDLSEGLAVGDLNSDGRKDIAQLWNGLVSVLYNLTEPKTTDYYLAPVVAVVDSGFSSTSTSTFYFTQTEVDSSNVNYFSIQIDFFYVNQIIQMDSIWVDSLFITEAYVCAKRFADTIVKSNVYLASSIVQSDTVFWSRTVLKQNTISEFKLYPNPTSGAITIALPAPFDLPNTSLTIYSEKGQVLERVVWSDLRNKRRIDISKYSSAVYLFQFQYQENTRVFRVVLKK